MYWGLMEREDIVTDLFSKEKASPGQCCSVVRAVLFISDRTHTQVTDAVPPMFLFLSLFLPLSLESYPQVRIKRGGEKERDKDINVFKRKYTS